jgi:hypothetical protein
VLAATAQVHPLQQKVVQHKAPQTTAPLVPAGNTAQHVATQRSPSLVLIAQGRSPPMKAPELLLGCWLEAA